MKVLIIGGGGREHALAYAAARSSRVREVLVAPGNAGTAGEPKTRNVAADPGDIAALVDLAEREHVDLVIVGPEAPLVGGLADLLMAAGIRCFGPPAAAARLEGSKSFAKAFMQRHGIPTARYATFTELAPALDYLADHPLPVVVKADGLAAGKGVIVASSYEEAAEALVAMLAERRFGQAGATAVIEEFLAGTEASFMVIASGEQYLELPTSRDHKRAFDGDRGPNTGGMGAISPAPALDARIREQARKRIVEPALAGLAAEGIPYLGFLYAGLMIDADGEPRVLEFNCRLGDPEAQPVLLRLESDLIAVLEAAFDGVIEAVPFAIDERPAAGVVLAAAGYPGDHPRGMAISGLDAIDDPAVKVFHAATRRNEHGEVVTTGGRVLCVTALGPDPAKAREHAYAAADRIAFDHCHLRRDIGL